MSIQNNLVSNLNRVSQEGESKLKQRFELLICEGKKTEATSPEVDINTKPDYLDEIRFREAQNVVNKYYLPLSTSSSAGLILLLQHDEILLPLLKTGKSHTVPDLYDRYSATALYIKKCYESSFYEPTSEGWRYITMVRGMHQRIFRNMNEIRDDNAIEANSLATNYNVGDDKSKVVWVNQYDMAITQFAFVGLLLLWPHRCGAPRITGRELGEITYFWRLLSRQLGIEERYNLFIYHDDINMQLAYIKLVYDYLNLKLLQSRNPIGVKMGEGFLQAFEDLTTFATYNIVERHWSRILSLSGRAQVRPYMGPSEWWKAVCYYSIFKLSSSSDVMRKYLTAKYKRKLEDFCKKSTVIKEKLAKKYPDHTFE